MSYRHYWKFTETPNRGSFYRAVEGCREIIYELEDWFNLGDAEGRPGSKPRFGDREIVFNGIGSDGNETFRISMDDRPGDFRSCNTDERDYDAVVCTCLLIFKDMLGDGFIIKTDGIIPRPNGSAANRGWRRAESYFNMYRNLHGRPEADGLSLWVSD